MSRSHFRGFVSGLGVAAGAGPASEAPPLGCAHAEAQVLLSLTCHSGVTVTVGFPVVPSELGRSPGSPRAGAGPPARPGLCTARRCAPHAGLGPAALSRPRRRAAAHAQRPALT